MKTVHDILQLLEKMVSSEDDEIKQHAATLVDKRTRGSTTKHSLIFIKNPSDRLLAEFNSEAIAEGCKCYSFYASELEGEINAAPLYTVIQDNTVSIREGEHGPELFINRPDKGGTETNWIYVIIGEHNGQEIIFTWHPGPPLKPFDGTLCADTAVKLHNGE